MWPEEAAGEASRQLIEEGEASKLKRELENLKALSMWQAGATSTITSYHRPFRWPRDCGCVRRSELTRQSAAIGNVTIATSIPMRAAHGQTRQIVAGQCGPRSGAASSDRPSRRLGSQLSELSMISMCIIRLNAQEEISGQHINSAGPP
jgi:hypothetical protein